MPYKDPARQRAAQREWCRKKREAALVGRHCERCGTTDELEFHHRDPEEKITHRIWSWSWERIAKELEKCDVLCRRCHAKHHATERAPDCGSNSSYRKGCRCAACTEAHRIANARYYRKAA